MIKHVPMIKKTWMPSVIRSLLISTLWANYVFFCNVSNVGSLAASKTDLFGLHGNCLDPSPNTAMVEMLKRGPCFKRFEGYNIKKYLYGSKVHTSWVFAISSNVTREKFPLSSMISSKKTSKLLVTMRRESHLGSV